MNIWALAAVSLWGVWGEMGAEGNEQTTSNVGNARYHLYNRAAGPGRPYSFAIVAPCGKMHYYSWQGLWRGTQGLGGTLDLGARSPTGTRTPHAGREGMPGPGQWVVPIAVTSRSPVVGTTHPCGCPWGQPGRPTSLDIPRGRCWDANKLTSCCVLARLGLAGGTRVSGRRGAAWQRGGGVCVCVLVFSCRSRPGATERALCLPARLPVTAPSVSQPPCTARSHFGRSCLGILMRLINTPRCNRGAGRTPSPALPFGGINNQTQAGTPTHRALPHPKLSWGMGPSRKHEVIPKGEVPMTVLSQPSELWRVMQTPLPSQPRGGRAGFGAGTGLC